LALLCGCISFPDGRSGSFRRSASGSGKPTPQARTLCRLAPCDSSGFFGSDRCQLVSLLFSGQGFLFLELFSGKLFLRTSYPVFCSMEWH
jgi:hypothetical protein